MPVIAAPEIAPASWWHAVRKKFNIAGMDVVERVPDQSEITALGCGDAGWRDAV